MQGHGSKDISRSMEFQAHPTWDQIGVQARVLCEEQKEPEPTLILALGLHPLKLDCCETQMVKETRAGECQSSPTLVRKEACDFSNHLGGKKLHIPCRIESEQSGEYDKAGLAGTRQICKLRQCHDRQDFNEKKSI